MENKWTTDFIIAMLIALVVAIPFNFAKDNETQRKIDNLQEVITATEQTEEKATEENSITDFEQFMTDYSTVNTNELLVIDESQLTEDMLLNRNGKLIISKCVGKVVSADKDGCIINKAADKNYDYISYKCVEDCKIDDIIVTYLIYNPDNNYTDDIISRFDYIVSTNKTEN